MTTPTTHPLVTGHAPTQAAEPWASPQFAAHFDRLCARRTDAEGEEILADALARLQARRANRSALSAVSSHKVTS